MCEKMRVNLAALMVVRVMGVEVNVCEWCANGTELENDREQRRNDATRHRSYSL